MEGTFYLNIERIHLAHEFVLNRVKRCEYPRGRGSYGLVYVLRGEAQYRFSTGERVNIGEGDVLLISPDCAYSIFSDEDFLHYTVNFSLHLTEESVAVLPSRYFCLRGEGTFPFERLFKRIVSIWQGKEIAYEMLAVSVLYEILACFIREHSRKNESDYLRLLPARTYIEKHFEESISLDALATLCRMSLTNFRREWKRHFQDTPLKYRDTLRLALAKEYLHTGFYTVTEIATKCGFDDASYFVRFFRKNVGLPPKEYQKKHME